MKRFENDQRSPPDQPWTRSAVERRLKRDFPEGDRVELMRILDLIQADPRDPEEHGRSRLQLDVLTLSQGDTEKLKANVEAAREDFRDVILWAEYPPSGDEMREGGTGS